MKSDRKNSFWLWLPGSASLLMVAVTLGGCGMDSNLNSQLEEIEIQLNQAETENMEIRAELEKLHSELSGISGNSKAVEDLLSSSSKDLTSTFRAGLRRNEQLIKEKEEALSQIQEELKNFQVKIAGLDEKNQEVIESMQSEISGFSKRLDLENVEMDGLSASQENLRTLHASLKSDLEQAMSRVKSNKEMKKFLDTQHLQIVELQHSLRKKSDSFNREMTRMEGYIKELRLEISRLAAIKSGE
jgi:chromosome segregation ATPase